MHRKIQSCNLACNLVILVVPNNNKKGVQITYNLQFNLHFYQQKKKNALNNTEQEFKMAHKLLLL